MAKVYLYTYTVGGTPSFPFDMLRYDQCWPASQEDAARIDRAGPQPGRKAAAFSITLHSHKLPTEGRWRSFGWSLRDDLNDTALRRVALD
jgi:hypothetical protein